MFDQFRVADAPPTVSTANKANRFGSEDLEIIRGINKSKPEAALTLPSITIVDNSPIQPTVRKVDDDAVVTQRDEEIVGIKYKDGQSRRFSWDNGELTKIQNPHGTELTKTSDGKWITEKNTDAGIINVQVDKSGRVSYEDTKKGEFIVIGTKGKAEKVDLPGDVAAYPDNNHRQAAVERIDKILDKKHLTEGGVATISDMHKLGLDDVDIWHGSYVSVQGDGGALYRKWSQLKEAHERDSSHEHIGQQYQLELGVGDGVVLFGIGPDGNTFFQVEHHASHEPSLTGAFGEVSRRVPSNVGNWLHGDFTFNDDHGRDKNLFDKIHQNIGKLGISPYIDKNPLIVGWHPNLQSQNYA